MDRSFSGERTSYLAPPPVPMDINDLLQNLREALELTPDNDKLRAHLARTLLTAGKAEEAATEFKRVLQRSPQDVQSKLGLAKAFAAQQQWSAAIVILEDLHHHGPPEHEVYLLYSRVLLNEGSFGVCAGRTWTTERAIGSIINAVAVLLTPLPSTSACVVV